MATIATAQAILNAVDVEHDYNTPLGDIAIALIDMDRAIRTFDPTRPMRVYDKVVVYKNNAQRTSHFNIWM
jgi:hypothetical protein